MTDCSRIAVALAMATLYTQTLFGQTGPIPNVVEGAVPVSAPAIPSNVFYGGWDGSSNAPGVVFKWDAAFLRYTQSGGVRDSRAPSAASQAQFDYDYSPRFSLGYEFGEGLGVRANYWKYDRFARTADTTSFVDIEASTLDLEIYRRFAIHSGLTLEAFGGFRQGQFDQTDGRRLNYSLDGWGGTVGLEAGQEFYALGRLYARARWSLVVADGNLISSGALDQGAGTIGNSQTAMTELAIGWNSGCRLGRCFLTYGVGAEWQQWTDTAIAGGASAEANLYDAGWAGFVFRAGLRF